MSPVAVTFVRTVKASRALYHTAFSLAGFLAAAAALFAFNLESAEGGRLSLAAVWAESVSAALPALAAFLCMDLWSEERRSGTVDALLSSPVLERDYVIGKFLGGWFMTMASTLLFWFASVLPLRWLAGSVPGAGFLDFLPAFFVLALQSALWCAVSSACSVCFRRSAAAAVLSIALTVALPRFGWAALQAWAPSGRTEFGMMPLDAHALDIASGMVSSSAVIAYPVLTCCALFIASKLVMSLRFVGRGSRLIRLTTSLAVLLSLAAAALAVALAVRLDVTLDIPQVKGEARFSRRTSGILAKAEGVVTVTQFMPRSDVRFREVSHFLRAFSREAEAAGAVRLQVRFVDPRWDFGPAARFIRKGVSDNSLVFERGHRMVALKLSDGFDERMCATAMRRLFAHSQRRTVYWTQGHGESGFDSYGPWGMSDIARELVREGYSNRKIDLASPAGVPSDCALVLVAGAKTEFSRVETGRLDSYLKQGGRMLALLSSSEFGGVARLLPTWGIRPVSRTPRSARTFTGSDVIVSDFSDHTVASGLAGTQVVLERPVVFEPSAVAGTVTNVESAVFSPIAAVDGRAVAAAVERGAGMGGDLGLRPTRIVAVGDSSFVMNAQLSSRANANRDFFLGCVEYLSGMEVSAAGGESGVLTTGLDRGGKRMYLAIAAAAFPLSVFLAFSMLVALRRRRG